MSGFSPLFPSTSTLAQGAVPASATSKVEPRVRDRLSSPFEMDESRIPSVSLILRPMHPSSSNLLVEVAGGMKYVLRIPEGTSAGATRSPSFKEALGSLLATSIGIPMAEWCPIKLTEGAIFYGSKVPESAGSLLEYLPLAWIAGTEAARQMIRMLVFDHWVRQPFRRQYIAFRRLVDGAFTIQFIGSSRILSDSMECSGRPGFKANPYTEAARLGVSCSVVEETASAIGALSGSALECLAAQVPPYWSEPVLLQSALRALVEQQGQLPALLSAWRDSA